jgi:predicted PurR-regulated permease PerM
MPSPLRPAEPEAALPSQIASKGSLGLRAPAGIEVAAIVVAALYFGREVLIPVTLAMLLSFVLSPLVELLRRVWADPVRRSRRGPGFGPDPCAQ